MAKRVRRKLWHRNLCETCAYRAEPLPEMDPDAGRCLAPKKGTYLADMSIIGPAKTDRACAAYLWRHDKQAKAAMAAARAEEGEG
jgi:hypothetical protein